MRTGLRRGLLVVVALAAAAIVGTMSAAGAGAQQCTVTATLLGGHSLTFTVDIPPGTPLSSLSLPVKLPVLAITGTCVAPPPAPPVGPPAVATGALPAGVPRGAGAARAQRRSAGAHARRPHRARARHHRNRTAGANTSTKTSAGSPASSVTLGSTGGVPTPLDPTFSLALPGPVPLGVPNFFIDNFRIPPFLLPIYEAAGIEYDVPWQVLGAINEVESDYGRDLSVSKAGAVGWMQFLPSTWRTWGVDANGDGVKDPYNPIDAIFAAARYLQAAGASQHLAKAIFAYNHASWYVQSVLLRARLIGGIPDALVGALTGLVEGHFPVAAPARYADGSGAGVNIFAAQGSPVIAVNDGKITGLGRTRALGRFVQLQDATGNTYTYAHLASVPRTYAVPKRLPVTAGRSQVTEAAATATATALKERLFAHPGRPASYAAGGAEQVASEAHQIASFAQFFTTTLHLARDQYTTVPLRTGAIVVAGTVLGRLGGPAQRLASHVLFEIEPAGRRAPRIDPKPILDGWKLLEATALYRASGEDPFFGPAARNPTVGQELLMTKEQLAARVLADPHVRLAPCEQREIQSGLVDRRVLAAIEFLAGNGLDPTVSPPACGQAGVAGSSADIDRINGIPVQGHQGTGSIADLAIRRLLTLQGALRPSEIVSLMSYPGQPETLALPDHSDRLQIVYTPLFGQNRQLSAGLAGALRPPQWIELVDRLSQIPEPIVSIMPSRYAIRASP